MEHKVQMDGSDSPAITEVTVKPLPRDPSPATTVTEKHCSCAFAQKGGGYSARMSSPKLREKSYNFI